MDAPMKWNAMSVKPRSGDWQDSNDDRVHLHPGLVSILIASTSPGTSKASIAVFGNRKMILIELATDRQVLKGIGATDRKRQ
jgi:hypothetical protein